MNPTPLARAPIRLAGRDLGDTRDLLQQNPLYVPPDELLAELRQRQH